LVLYSAKYFGRKYSIFERIWSIEDFHARTKEVTYLALAPFSTLDSAHWNLIRYTKVAKVMML